MVLYFPGIVNINLYRWKVLINQGLWPIRSVQSARIGPPRRVPFHRPGLHVAGIELVVLEELDGRAFLIDHALAIAAGIGANEPRMGRGQDRKSVV